MKRIGFALLWAVAFYFVACVVVGAVAGGIAGANERDPQRGAAAGAKAGGEAVNAYRLHIAAGGLALAALGALAGILPGTHASSKDNQNPTPFGGPPPPPR